MVAKAETAAARAGIDWSSLWKKEDWWAVWVGFAILIIGVVGILPRLPAIDKWTVFGRGFSAGVGTLWTVLGLFAFSLALTLIASAFLKANLRRYVAGFSAVFGLAMIATWVAKYTPFSKYGLEVVLWALVLGLLISNVVRVPAWLKAGAQTEFFVKVGLVLLGAETLFSTIIKGGAFGMAQAVLVVVAVWFVAYWIARRLGLAKDFSSVMASGVSICGVSAAIAAGGAIKGDQKQVSHVISLVLLLAMPMLVVMPIVAHALGMGPAFAGAWMGGTIDTTGAVVAAGTLVDPKVGLQVASLTKMSQNVLIGVAAFLLAGWAAFSLRRDTGADRPRAADIWFRFPKFIIGFVLASIFFSLVVEPSLGATKTSSVIALTSGYRNLFFALAFVSIGLDTRFRDLVAVGKGRPLLAFVSAQAFNILWTLLIAWLLWSGTLFAAPIK